MCIPIKINIKLIFGQFDNKKRRRKKVKIKCTISSKLYPYNRKYANKFKALQIK